MKIGIWILALAIIFGPTLVTFSQESPAKEEPAKEEPAKDESAEAAAAAAAPAAAEAAAPAAAAAAAPAAAAAAAPAPAVAPPAAAAAAPAAAVPAVAAEKPAAPQAPKELSSSARSLQPLANSYKQAYDDMQKWIAEVDSKASAADENVRKLQTQIQTNEDGIKTAKAAGDNSKAKALTKENKKLATDLETAKKSAATASSSVTKEASERAKGYAASTNKALTEIKQPAK